MANTGVFDLMSESPDAIGPPATEEEVRRKRRGGTMDGPINPVVPMPPIDDSMGTPAPPQMPMPGPMPMQRQGQSVMGPGANKSSVFAGIPDYAGVFDMMAPMQRPDWRTLLGSGQGSFGSESPIPGATPARTKNSPQQPYTPPAEPKKFKANPV